MYRVLYYVQSLTDRPSDPSKWRLSLAAFPDPAAAEEHRAALLEKPHVDEARVVRDSLAKRLGEPRTREASEYDADESAASIAAYERALDDVARELAR